MKMVKRASFPLGLVLSVAMLLVIGSCSGGPGIHGTVEAAALDPVQILSTGGEKVVSGPPAGIRTIPKARYPASAHSSFEQDYFDQPAAIPRGGTVQCDPVNDLEKVPIADDLDHGAHDHDHHDHHFPMLSETIKNHKRNRTYDSERRPTRQA